MQRVIAVHERRLIEIESKLAHQEDLLVKLDGALTNQQSQLTRLEALCDALIDRLRSSADASPQGDPTDERPPHY